MLFIEDAAASFHAFYSGHGAFDFFQLDAVPHIFDLKILSSGENQLSVFIVAPQITRPVYGLGAVSYTHLDVYKRQI